MRYFVPDHEMGVSGHAMVAGVTVAVNGKVRAVLSRAARSSERNEQLTQFVVTRY
jgi:predicted PhzF superfamily epimerase YddE/YHI9